MRRKLLLLNVALTAAILMAGWRLRLEWLGAKAREHAVLSRTVKPLPPPPIPKLPAAQPVKPATFADIAEKMLFSKDRNPTVVVEVPPPPPKPMPPLPIFHGIMNLGDGPSAILSEKVGAPHKDLRPGDKIGEFTLTAINADSITLEWDGKEITKRLDELMASAALPPPAPAPAVQKAAARPAAEQPKGEPRPGVDIGRGNRACQPGDPSPAGTVVDGMKKVLVPSPFGTRCWWEPAQ